MKGALALKMLMDVRSSHARHDVDAHDVTERCSLDDAVALCNEVCIKK